jgi:phytanoyl-CoA hydroxylase
MPVVPLSSSQIATLREQGFVIARSFVTPERRAALRAAAQQQLAAGAAPAEYEADLAYPGAPASRQSAGGQTVRRLLDAYARDPLFAAWATAPELAATLRDYFGDTPVLSRAHHNCIMTKDPRYGSQTGWHRDIRYWSFDRDDLVSVWLALGPENAQNGGLWLVPGSHRLDLPAERFDGAQFLRPELPENAEIIFRAVPAELEEGDVLFFHARTLHSAGQNHADRIKFSIVHTYHAMQTHPRPGTRSASKPEVVLDAP